MKIAICLSGQARMFKHTIDSLKKHVLDLYDCDIFIDTWKFNLHKEDTNSFYRYSDGGTLEELFELYNPCVLNIENFNKNFEKACIDFENAAAKIDGYRQDNYLRRYYAMLYKIYNCNKIKAIV